PSICQENLVKLQVPLAAAIDKDDMDFALTQFWEHYAVEYRQLIINRLGFDNLPVPEATELLKLTIEFLQETQVGYHDFFAELRGQFSPEWRDDASKILSDKKPNKLLDAWRDFYYHLLQNLSNAELEEMGERLRQKNPEQGLIRPVIESVWEAISVDDNWQPFYDLVNRIHES
ncbi:MAG: YdiU family protein, partial [Okeania sp. SIO2H7]|nr:YdiU family protein [Okeania sp. SIO2H7]